ncbi:hypothetical protein ASF41_13020 [Methylobacterium sp. Leaf111]|uniref:site-specific integrase n=1 Tax=Methylobacterium sp. Leaf111 TaxID=1736257 RepID=UPI0006F2AB2F|nr:site-specific integrase [Methylobacterium sp. Leaf111]KQP51105.1 hypothetical protein ASF41_13020 [Methylobacterium sp. Leaf111]
MAQNHGVWKPKNSSNYYCSFSVAGKRFNKSTGCSNKQDAIAFSKRWKAAEIRNAAKAAEELVPGGDIVFLDAADKYLGSKSKGGRSSYREKDIDWLVDNIGPETLLSTISNAMIGRLVEKRRLMTRWGRQGSGLVAEGTVVNGVIRPASAIMNYAMTVLGVRLPSMPKWGLFHPQVFARKRELSFGEEVALVPAIGDYADLVRFMLRTGLRRGSALLRWRDVHMEENAIRVCVKGGKFHELRMTQAIRDILVRNRGLHPEFVFTYEAREEGVAIRRPITANGFAYRFRATTKKLRIEDLTIHDLRRTAGARMYRATGDIYAVSKFLGHANVAITQKHYVHITPTDVLTRMDQAEASYVAMLAKAVANHAVVAEDAEEEDEDEHLCLAD